MGDPRIDRIAARQAAQTAVTRLTVAPLMADTAKMSDEQVGKLTALFDVFDPDGHAYSVGDVARTTAGFSPIGGIQRGPYSNLSGWFGSLQVWYKEVTAPISSLAFTSEVD